jgi:hypothetical protein
MGKSKDLASGNSAAYVETAGDTMTGNLGIGGSPSVNLDVSSSGNTFALVKNTSSGSGLYIKADTDGDSEIQTAGGNNNIIFRASGVERMQIDSSGRVTMPYQPWFHVVLNSNVTSVTTGNQLLNAWGAGIKGGVGSHFSSNKFTAPVAGKYLFCYSGLHNSGSGGYSRAYHAVNGAVVIDGLGDDGTSGNYQRIAYSIILSLAANDYVEIKVNSAQSDAYVYSYYTTWSGQLIG